jgi:hypothetical protein
MAALPSDRVRQGFWIDYTHGPILGSTITTTSSNANIAIAFLSVLVAFTGAHLWDLLALIRFWAGVSKRPRDTFHQQLQILLRNASSPGTFLLYSTLVGWSWRHHGGLRRLAGIAALAFLCSTGFIIVGIFVSQVVATTGLQVLAHSASCGWVSWRNESTALNLDYQETIFNQAYAYVQTCYNKTGLLSQCSSYVKQNVPILETTHTDCPFGSICSTPSALKLDTGLLDSNDVFGINADLSLRVKMQRVVTCAPIASDEYFTAQPLMPDFSARWFGRNPLPGEQLFEWYMGPETGSLGALGCTILQTSAKVMFTTGVDLTYVHSPWVWRILTFISRAVLEHSIQQPMGAP